jgi:hypothetical protein
VHTGVRVSAHGGERALALDPAAIADGLAAWEAEGVHHVQLWVEPVTTTGVALALEGLRRFRG